MKRSTLFLSAPTRFIVIALLLLPLLGQATDLRAPMPGHDRAQRARLLPLVERIAGQYDLDPLLVDSLIVVESGYNPNAVSSAGAIGLMQVLPTTAADYGINGDLTDPRTNLLAGTRHLRRLLRKYHGSMRDALIAYNSGEGAAGRPRLNGVRYAETRQYWVRVINLYHARKFLD